jgi:hypothetical protein
MDRPAAAAHGLARWSPSAAGFARRTGERTRSLRVEEGRVSVEDSGSAPSGPGELQQWEGAVALCLW